MKKKLVLPIFCLSLLSLIGCSKTYYSVKFVLEDGTVLKESEVLSGEKAVYDGSEPAKESTAEKVYTFDGWKLDDAVYESNDLPEIYSNCEFVATFKEEAAKYTVTWIVGDEKTEETYTFGEAPSFKGDSIKESTEKFDYKFIGWDKEIVPVKENVTYTAIFEESLRNYEVTWVVDGKETKETYPYGETPSFKGELTKAEDEKYTYKFDKWDKEIVPVNGNVTYTAIFLEELKEYEITWVVGNDKFIEKYHYEDVPTFKGDTNLESSAEFDYTFKGWDKEITPVTSNETYVAQFDKKVRSYVVNFYDEDGITLLYSETLEYGDVPVFESTIPSKEGTNFFEYVFEGWKLNDEFFSNDKLPEIIGETNFIASFKEIPKLFDINVRYLNLEGELIQETKVGENGYNSLFEFEVNGINNLEPNLDKVVGYTISDQSFDVYLSEVDVYDGTTVSPSLSGDGTENSPYLIQNGADLAYFKSLVDNKEDLTDTYFKLTKSIDLSNTEDFRIGVNSTFGGIFDGNNCVIKGINYNSKVTRNSLFYQTTSTAQILNLTTKGDVKGAQYCGGIVGLNAGLIENCNNFVNIEQDSGNGAGGISGGNKGKIINSSNYGNITCLNVKNNKTAGITGAGEGGSYIENCVNYGDISGFRFLGGIVGENQSSANDIVSSINFGNITGEGQASVDRIDMGGIAGTIVDQDLTDSVNYGEVKGIGADSKYVGGIVGTFKSGNIKNNVNNGKVTNEAVYTGGIAGCAVTNSQGNIDGCINNGGVESSNNGVGGILGGTIKNTCNVTITNSENFGDISGNNKVGGISGALTGGTADESNKNHGKITAVGTDFGDIIGSTK